MKINLLEIQRITSTDLKVHERIYRFGVPVWSTWEDINILHGPQYKPDSRFQEVEGSLSFAILTIHYWKRSDFLDHYGVLENIARSSLSHVY